MKRKTIDRRGEGRLEMGHAVLLSMAGRSPIVDAPAVMVELSATGLRLRMATAPAKHRIASLRIDVDNDTYTAAGRVVRVEAAPGGGHLVGIEFDPESLQDNPFPACLLGDPPTEPDGGEPRR